MGTLQYVAIDNHRTQYVITELNGPFSIVLFNEQRVRSFFLWEVDLCFLSWIRHSSNLCSVEKVDVLYNDVHRSSSRGTWVT